MENCKLFLAIVFISYDWSKFSNTETHPSKGEEFYKCFYFVDCLFVGSRFILCVKLLRWNNWSRNQDELRNRFYFTFCVNLNFWISNWHFFKSCILLKFTQETWVLCHKNFFLPNGTTFSTVDNYYQLDIWYFWTTEVGENPENDVDHPSDY